MKHRSSLSIRPLLVAAAAAGGALSAPAGAQDTYLYAFNSDGRVVANGYALDTLPHGKQTDDEDETWHDLFIQGTDRWLLRGDGRIGLNGDLLEVDLEGDAEWQAIVVDGNLDFTALRLDGHVAGPLGSLVNLPDDDFNYPDMVADGNTVYVLKTNGAIFRVPLAEPLIKFDGPPGETDDEEDGEAADTRWIRLLINPADGNVWALRGDGTLMSAEIPLLPPLTPDPGELVVSLPYDQSDDEIDIDELYSDFTFDEKGGFFAIRSDGKLYSTDSSTEALLDYPGDPSEDLDESYESVVLVDGVPNVLRADGKIFGEDEAEAIIDLKDAEYIRLALGTELPNLANVKNQAPFCSKAELTAPEGTDLEVPVVVADRDLPAEDLLVAAMPDTLPAGATFDEETRVITWPGAGPAGKYKIKITVDDGIAKTLTAVQSIVIKPLDANETKNIKPTMGKVKGAVALVGIPFVLTLSTFDLDGDETTMTLNPNGPPLPEGATFDEGTKTLTWDAPLLSDTGTHEFKFLVSDGTVEVKTTLKVKVQSSLLTF